MRVKSRRMAKVGRLWTETVFSTALMAGFYIVGPGLRACMMVLGRPIIWMFVI